MRQNRSLNERKKHDIQPCRLSLGTSAFRSDAFDRSRPKAVVAVMCVKGLEVHMLQVEPHCAGIHMLRTLALLATVLGVSGCGEASDFDIRCYSVGMIALAAEPNNASVLQVTAYYLGRMDAADPSGEYAQSVMDTMQMFHDEPSSIGRQAEFCANRMDKSVSTVRAALESSAK